MTKPTPEEIKKASAEWVDLEPYKMHQGHVANRLAAMLAVMCERVTELEAAE
jgi:hypothetical protein